MALQKIPMLALLPSLILAGCGNGIPDCDDSKIREMVADVAEDRFDEEAYASIAGAVIVEIDDIRMLNYDTKTRTRQCVARASLTGPGG